MIIAHTQNDSRLEIMTMMNLFSEPLDFECTDGGIVNVTAFRDKSSIPGEFISKSLVFHQVQMPSSQAKQRQVSEPKINDPTQLGYKKRKQSKPLKKNNKVPKYADYDGLMISCEGHGSSMNWPGSTNNDVLALDRDRFERSVICYEDPVSSSIKSKKKRSKKLKAAKKNNNNSSIGNTVDKNISNINNNNTKIYINTGNVKTKGKIKKPQVKNISQKGPDNVLGDAAPSYKSGYSSNLLNTLGVSCSVFDEQNGKSLKRKAEDIDERKSKSRRVCDEWTPIFEDKKLAEPTEETLTKNKKSQEPLSKSKLRKIEKSKVFWNKMKEKETRDAAHQQGLQRKIVPCKYYVNGCCNKGTDCTFSHDVPQVKKDEPCKFYVMSQCTKEGCLYRHGEWPCKFFHGQKGCRNNNCKFSHEPLTEITKKWLDKIFEEGESATKSEKEDKVEVFKVESSALECSIDSFYGSTSKQTFQEVIQPKQESELSYEAPQPININEVNNVFTWGCCGDLEPSNNFNILRIDTPRKHHISLFEFFKHKIECHRLKEHRDHDPLLPKFGGPFPAAGTTS